MVLISCSPIEHISSEKDKRFAKCICKIGAQKWGGLAIANASGFLCKFQCGSMGPVMGMFTCNNVLDEKGNYSMTIESIRYEITDDQVERFWSDKDIEVTFVIFKQEFAQKLRDENGCDFLEISNDEIAVGSSVTILQHPKGEDASVSRGNIKDCLIDTIHYTASTLPGSAGSPLLDDNYRVIGIHQRGCYHAIDRTNGGYNIGTPIKLAIDYIKGSLEVGGNSADERVQVDEVLFENAPIDLIFSENDKRFAKGLCKIQIEKKGKPGYGSGFLCGFQSGSKGYVMGMFTNHHVLGYKQEYQMTIEKNVYAITDDQVDTFWTDKNIDVTFVTFKEEFAQQLRVRCHFFKVSYDEITVRSNVTILQHPLGGDASVSREKVKDCCNCTLSYTAGTNYGSSGSPVLDDEYRVVGIHKRGQKYRGQWENVGTLIKCAINYFKCEEKEAYPWFGLSLVSMKFGREHSVDWNTIESRLNYRDEWTKMVQDVNGDGDAELHFPPISLSLDDGSSKTLVLFLKRLGAGQICVYGGYHEYEDGKTLPQKVFMTVVLVLPCEKQVKFKRTKTKEKKVEMKRKGEEGWNELLTFKKIDWGDLSSTNAPSAKLTFQEA